MELFDFIKRSPNPYFAVLTMKEELEKNGFSELFEGDEWHLDAGKYFVTRDGSSLIAFSIPENGYKGFQILASHSDSPAFKIKTNAQMRSEDFYIKLNTEKYGGMILSTWFDRPLSIAGRIIVKTDEGLESKTVNIDRDLLMIPSLAIHMDRSTNDGHKYVVQKELLPLFAGANKKDLDEKDSEDKDMLLSLIAEAAGIRAEDILDSDLFLYNRQEPVVYGANKEFMAAPRLDDLQCAYASLMGFLSASPSAGIAVHAVFNNEEVGSETKQGAASSFLTETLRRINTALGNDETYFYRALSSSFLVSADNAHAIHPNYSEKADPTNKPLLNGGIVIKYNANQHYATDGVSAGVFRMICERAKVPVQEFVNSSDIPGGSTLGSIAVTRLSMNTVDIGLPQLSMHSAYETAGTYDTEYLCKAAAEFFSTAMISRGDGEIKLQRG
ncbi:MAG: M18 family aminopeptidase [Lachnospiraceae bacterium]|nr:M18 family aminopeptidase [Lachnospiraceae bacterium]